MNQNPYSNHQQQHEAASSSSLAPATGVEMDAALQRAMATARIQYGLPTPGADGAVEVIAQPLPPWAVISAPSPPLPPPSSSSLYEPPAEYYSTSYGNNVADFDNQSTGSWMTSASAPYQPCAPYDEHAEEDGAHYFADRPPAEVPGRRSSSFASTTTSTTPWSPATPFPSAASSSGAASLSRMNATAPPTLAQMWPMPTLASLPAAVTGLTLSRHAPYVQPLRCVSLYDHGGSKALLMPVRPQSDALLYKRAFTHHQLNAAEIKSEGECLKIKLPEKTWNTVHDSRLVLLDFCRAMIQEGGETLCVAANLSRKVGPHAATLFFRPPEPAVLPNGEEDGQATAAVEVACISFPDPSTVRFDQVPSNETRGIQKLVQEFCEVYHLGSATRGPSEIDIPSEILKAPGRSLGRFLITGILQQMIDLGWTQCVPVHCMTHRQDPVHTLLLIKSQTISPSSGMSSMSLSSHSAAAPPAQESCTPTCCISLVDKSAISVFGLDEFKASEKAFIKAIKEGWKQGVAGPTRNGPVMTLTCKGEPWKIHTTKASEAMAARRLVCRLLEAMFQQGWSCYAATCMSFLPDESSSFVLIKKKNTSPTDSLTGRICTVGCLHLFGANEMHFIKMPAKLLDHLVKLFDCRDRPWPLKSPPERPDTYNLVVHLRDNPWVGPAKSEFKAALAKCMISVFYEIERVGEGKMSCTANIADSEHHSPIGCDSFFFTFPPLG